MTDYKRVRVAYDVSFQASLRYRPEKVTGVGRVIEEVMACLAQYPEVDLKIAGLYSGDIFPVGTDLGVKELWSSYKKQWNVGYSPAFRSRSGLAAPLQQMLLEREKRQTLRSLNTPAQTDAPLRERIEGKLLRTLANWDSIPCLNEAKIDIFHATFNPLPARELTGKAARLITIYDIFPLRYPEGMENGFWQRIVDSVDRDRDWAVAISEFSKADFCDYADFPAERVFVSPLAVSESLQPVADPQIIEDCRRKYGIPDGPYFLSVCNPQPRKNIPHLIRSFFHLLESNPSLDINLVLSGSLKLGMQSQEIFTALEKAPALKDRVHITGFVAEEDLAALYSGSTAFVFPSLFEGFGLPVLEAMQCGVPVICSNVSSVPEVAGDAAILVDPKDEDQLCHAMQSVAEQAPLRNTLSEKSLARASLYSWESTAQKTREIYQIMTRHD